MKELQRKQRIRHIIYSIPSLMVLLVITFVLARGAIRVVGKERESAARTMVLEEKTATLVIREKELEEGITSIKTEEGIKNEIKEKFNVIQEGEWVAFIVDDRNVSTSTDGSRVSWYKRLWTAIIGNQ